MALRDYIDQMYDAQLRQKNEQLTRDRDTTLANLETERINNQRKTDASLNKTSVDSQKAMRNYAETQNAYGLSSGAMAQARLASANQLQSDMTALRAQQLANDADIERRRSQAADTYMSAFREAQAANDAARAEKLYNLAKSEESAYTSGSSGGGYYGGSGSTTPTSNLPQNPYSNGNGVTETPDSVTGHYPNADIKSGPDLSLQSITNWQNTRTNKR